MRKQRFFVFDTEFRSFNEVERWAWDTYKIQPWDDVQPWQHEYAIADLETLIQDLNREVLEAIPPANNLIH